MIETILYFVLAFGGGYFAGHKDSTRTVSVECRDSSLITVQCVEIFPPADESFGATTDSYISLIDTYKKCKSACTSK